MMFTDEQLAFSDAIRALANRDCGTREQRAALLDDGEEDHSSVMYRRYADLGWLGVAIPEEYGGSGGTYVDQTILFEESFRGLVPVKAIGATTTVAGCYKRFGSEQQRKDALAAIAGGEVMSISISEPGAGSDVAAISCQATKVDDGYILNGQKTWCSYAHLAGRILLVARTSNEEKRHNGLTIFEVPRDSEGIETRRISTLGGREVNDVFYTDCFVPATNVVGEVGRGFQQIMAGLDGERLLAAAVGIGIAQRALEDLLTYLKQRHQFGRPLADFQALRHRVADLAIDLESSRLLTYEVAQRLEEAPDDPQTTRLTSMAKVKATETSKRMSLEGLQMMGGYGYATEYDMESHVRHSLVLPIYAGANEVQRDIISAQLGLR